MGVRGDGSRSRAPPTRHLYSTVFARGVLVDLSKNKIMGDHSPSLYGLTDSMSNEVYMMGSAQGAPLGYLLLPSFFLPLAVSLPAPPSPFSQDSLLIPPPFFFFLLLLPLLPSSSFPVCLLWFPPGELHPVLFLYNALRRFPLVTLVSPRGVCGVGLRGNGGVGGM